MLRSALLVATATVMMVATAAMADDKSDCQNGVAMIKAELKKNHPKPVLETARVIVGQEAGKPFTWISLSGARCTGTGKTEISNVSCSISDGNAFAR